MSHLGDRLSALVDGELDGAERDRAHAHLASCEQCRAEAAELRALKQKLRALTAGAPAEAAMTSRLIAMTGPGGPLPPRRRLLRLAPAGGPAVRWRTACAPACQGAAARRRYLMLGAVSLVVGLGTAAFTAGGGGEAAPGPRITPPVEMYSVEHAITTGEVPFTGPSARPSAAASTDDSDVRSREVRVSAFSARLAVAVTAAARCWLAAVLDGGAARLAGGRVQCAGRPAARSAQQRRRRRPAGTPRDPGRRGEQPAGRPPADPGRPGGGPDVLPGRGDRLALGYRRRDACWCRISGTSAGARR